MFLLGSGARLLSTSSLKTQQAVTGKESGLRRYQDVMVGSRSVTTTLYFEWCSWLAPLPGALGLMMRKIFWPKLFKQCGPGVMFGVNMILRHPGRISIGKNTVLSEGVLLDARHSTESCAIRIGDEVILANNTMISCKEGTVEVGNRTGIGAYTVIQSAQHCPVSIGEDAILGPRCYLVGGGNYHIGRSDIPIAQQGIRPSDGCRVGAGAWLGANVSILDGAHLGKGSIAAAGAVVVKPVAAREIVGGVPARTIGQRDND